MSNSLNHFSNNLPSSSVASVGQGFWYVFFDGPNVIRAWGSTWLGLERVYFNDQVVDQDGHIKRREHYAFLANDHEYRIQCIVHDQHKWQTECLLWRDGIKIDGWRCKRKKILTIRPTIAHLITGIVAGVIGGLFNMPIWYGILFVFSAIILTLISTAKTKGFVFERFIADTQVL